MARLRDSAQRSGARKPVGLNDLNNAGFGNIFSAIPVDPVSEKLDVPSETSHPHALAIRK